jgi:broad specificity phosphatase PhoE
MHLVLMRHGKTDWNYLKKIQGTKDVPINQDGIVNVKETCHTSLKDHRISKIVTSNLLRARQSAIICGRLLGIPINVLSYFQERSFGILEGKTIEEIQNIYNISNIETIDHSIHGVEDMLSVRQRINKGLDFLLSNYQDEVVLLVTHGSVIRSIAKDYGIDIGIIDNGSFIELEINRE